MIHAGVDFGTAFSHIAFLNEAGAPLLVPDSLIPGCRSTPSLVQVNNGRCLVGKSAEAADGQDDVAAIDVSLADPANTESLYSEPSGQTWSAAALSALLLKKLKGDAELFTADHLASAVVTVPARYTPLQRRAVKQAAILADLPIARIVEEPLAAAVYYEIAGEEKAQKVLLYDLGSHAFNVSVVLTQGGALSVAGSESLAFGGKKLDLLIANFLGDQFTRAHTFDPREQGTPVTQLLTTTAEQMKIELASGKPLSRKTLVLCGKSLECVLTRTQFDQIAEPLLQQTFDACRTLLDKLNLGWSDLNRVMLIGGSTQLPVVRRNVSAESGKAESAIICKNPQHAVVYGAAILASRIAVEGCASGVGITNPVTTAMFGFRVLNPETRKADVQRILDYNIPLPAQQSVTLYTSRPDQQRMILEIVQVKPPAEITSLGHFAFGPLQASSAAYPVEVTLVCDEEGLLNVTARDPKTSRMIDFTVQGQAEQVRSADYAKMYQAIREIRINE